MADQTVQWMTKAIELKERVSFLESQLASLSKDRDRAVECLREAHQAYFEGIGNENESGVFMEVGWVDEAEDIIGWGKPAIDQAMQVSGVSGQGSGEKP